MPSSDKNKNTQRHHTPRELGNVQTVLACPERRRQLLVSENLTYTQPRPQVERAESRDQEEIETRVLFKSCWPRQRFSLETQTYTDSWYTLWLNSELFDINPWYSHSLGVSCLIVTRYRSQAKSSSPGGLQLMDPNQREMSWTSLPNQTNTFYFLIEGFKKELSQNS